jgi:EAL domain-containing protein (putative c-di-GMP-specific phosphodiesterase class I)
MMGALSRAEAQNYSAYISPAANVQHALKTVRAHLGMDVALVCEFVGDKLYIRHVSARRRSPVSPGDWLPLEHCYCPKVAEGRLPEIIPDTAALPVAMAMSVTHSIPIGAYVSAPLRLANGRVYGSFCCLSFHADVSLDEHDLDLIRAFADLTASYIDSDLEDARRRAEKVERIEAILRSSEPLLVYQPVVRLSDMSIAGAEALSRFRSEPVRSPDKWFTEAGEVGLKTELELKTMHKALAEYRSLWRRAPLYLGLNSSPQTIVEGSLTRLLPGLPADRIILEITEHDYVEDYDQLRRALQLLRAAGVKIAIDDAGSGYASMRHILNVAPDFIKLDNSLTREIDKDGMRRALAGALIAFGSQTNCHIVAEGVETTAELETLRELGVHAAQGYHLARPSPIDGFRRILREERAGSAGTG